MVNLKPLAIIPLSKLRAVKVHLSQQVYVGTIEQFIDSCEWGVHKLGAFKNGQIIGYLKVDFAYTIATTLHLLTVLNCAQLSLVNLFKPKGLVRQCYNKQFLMCSPTIRRLDWFI